MSTTQKKLMTNWRWWLCSLLFVATTVNYLDRQVLSLTYKEFIAPEFHWTDANYGTITSFFSIFYAIACLFAGKFVDWMGTKKGYLIAIGVWSAGACLHAACGWATAGLVDGVIKEPLGGAHRDYDTAAVLVKKSVKDALSSLDGKTGEQLKTERYAKFRKIAFYQENAAKKETGK